MSEDMNQARTFEVLTAEPIRKRRKPKFWSEEDKAQILQEALSPGANVSAVARAHGMDPSQLFGWRRTALASGSIRRVDGEEDQEEKFTRFEGERDEHPTFSNLFCGLRTVSRIVGSILECLIFAVMPCLKPWMKPGMK